MVTAAFIRFFTNLYLSHIVYCSKSINLFKNGVFDINRSRWAKIAFIVGFFVNVATIVIFLTTAYESKSVYRDSFIFLDWILHLLMFI